MALDTPVGSNFDGVLPWSDLFSVYNLFEKNGNVTEKFTYTNSPGERYSHGSICKMPAAQDYIEKVFTLPLNLLKCKFTDNLIIVKSYIMNRKYKKLFIFLERHCFTLQ
ncbi:hypothetical protein AAFF39_10100 [Lactococcus garvieae]